MLRTLLKQLSIVSSAAEPHAVREHERGHLYLAVALLLHEATRLDLKESPKELAASKQAIAELFGLPPEECEAIVIEGREKAKGITSCFATVSVIRREFSLLERVSLIEHIWRVAYADSHLDYYEDHFVRKIAHLLHVPNTQTILARNRARSNETGKSRGARQ
jgi:uncharacterized tellurite resistance protein B-like protein